MVQQSVFRSTLTLIVVILTICSIHGSSIAQSTSLLRGMKELPIVIGADSNFAKEQIVFFERSFRTSKSKNSIEPQNMVGWQTDIAPPNGSIFKISSTLYLTPQYIGGAFDSVGDSAAQNIAQFDAPLFNIGDSDYQYIAMGSGVDGPVYTILSENVGAIVGGHFTDAGGVIANNIAYWNDTSWFPLGTGTANGLDSTVLAMARTGDSLIVGGNFTHAGGQVANHIAIWSLGQAKWLPLIDSGGINGLNGGVDAIAIVNASIFAGGGFTHAGSVSCKKIGQFTNGVWSPLGIGIGGSNSIVNVIGTPNGNGPIVYVGGSFDSTGGVELHNIGEWKMDSLKWSPLQGYGSPAEGVNGPVNDICFRGNGGDYLGIAGEFDSAGEGLARNLATFDYYDSWWEFEGGLDGPGYSIEGTFIAVSAPTTFNNFWVGGGFSAVGGIHSPNLAFYFEEARSVPPTLSSSDVRLSNSPNPFTNHAMISYDLQHSGFVSLEIYDPIGRLVSRLVDKEEAPGKYSVEFIPIANAPAGVYLSRLSSADGVLTAKMVLLR